MKSKAPAAIARKYDSHSGKLESTMIGAPGAADTREFSDMPRSPSGSRSLQKITGYFAPSSMARAALRLGQDTGRSPHLLTTIAIDLRSSASELTINAGRGLSTTGLLADVTSAF